MDFQWIKPAVIIYFGVTLPLNAAPQDLDNFTDFEEVSGEGDEFIIGDPPNTIRVIGFTLEDVVSPTLAHSGARALVLTPGKEGKILFERGVNLLQFYAAESTGGARIELRDRNFEVLSPNGLVIGLPTTISPGANPLLQSFVAYSGDFTDASDMNFTNGITEIKVVNVNGVFALDDLGFTYVEGPPNNTVYEDFERRFNNPLFADPTEFTLGQSPYTAHFANGFVGTSGRESFNHTFPAVILIPNEFVSGGGWIISDNSVGTITFETPAAQVQFYAAVVVEGEGEINVFDTNDNLITSTREIPRNIEITSVVPFTFFDFNAAELGAPNGIGKVTYHRNPGMVTGQGDIDDIVIDDIGFTPIGAPGSGTEGPIPSEAPSIITQPISQEVQSGTALVLSVTATGDDLSYQWYEGNSGDVTNPIAGATDGTIDTGILTESRNFWVAVTGTGGSADSDTAVITVAVPSVPLVLDGAGDIAGENIQHPNGNIFDQVLLTGETIQLQARPGQITRVSFMDEDEDIVQVEFSGAGTFTVTLDPATFLPPALPPRYNQEVSYVTGKPSLVIDGADDTTFFSIFTVGSINAVNQALFPEGQVYDAQADVTLVEVINSTGMGGMQLANTVFSGDTGKVGIDARGVPIAVRLTIGDIDASGDAVPHLLFGEDSFTVPAGNQGLRITGGDFAQANGASIIVAEGGSTTLGFETLFSQNNFKSDGTDQPTQSIDATFRNEDGDEITVSVIEVTIN